MSLRYAFDIDVDLAIIIEKQWGKMKKKKPQKQIEEDEEKKFDCENQIDNEEEEVNLVKWYAKEKFFKGKPKSIDTFKELDGLANQD